MKVKTKAPTVAAPTKRKRKGKMQKQLAKMNGTSKLEDTFEEILKEMGVGYVKHYRFGKREFDFCIPDASLLIECHGCYWHACKECDVVPKYGPQKRSVKNDFHKVKLVEASLEYKLVTFWEHDINKNKPKVILELLEALL